jgi:ABC-2 type transport system ATP-binding protein
MHKSPENALSIKGLCKTYRAGRHSPAQKALDDVSLTVEKGSILGLLAPNGAGKSTLINIMAGLVVKSAGDVVIWGNDIDRHPRNARASIGVVPQEINYDPFFTARKLLDIQAGMYGVKKAQRRTDELLDLVGLNDKADAYSRSLSGGMRRRLMVAKAMVHNPPILVLDEPTAGVDVELRQQLWENVRALNRKGLTVLLTTHYLEEAEELCDSIAIINHGRIVVSEDKETLLSRIDSKEIRFRLDRPLDAMPDDLSAFDAEKEGRRTILIRYRPEETNAGAMIAAIQQAGYGIADISTENSDLEDVFLQLTRA